MLAKIKKRNLLTIRVVLVKDHIHVMACCQFLSMGMPKVVLFFLQSACNFYHNRYNIFSNLPFEDLPVIKNTWGKIAAK